MDEFTEKLASIGIPALILLAVMSTTGLAGAAAITAALALLGPGGMIGGIVTLLVISGGISLITRYGYSAVMIQVSKKIMQKEKLTNEEMLAKIDTYPVTKGLKEKIKSKILESIEENNK